MKFFLTFALLLLALPVLAIERVRVPATDITAVAMQWLEMKAKEENIPARFTLVGHMNDVQSNSNLPASLKVSVPKSGWLRPRIGIPVQIFVDDKVISTVTVWFAVTAPHAGLVYAKNQNKSVLTEQLNVDAGQIDLARTKGKVITSLENFSGMRLRRAVSVGQALQADDFELIPIIQAQQLVRVETSNGPVHLSIAGRALGDASIGDMVQVLPANAAQPVRARVVSKQVVVIEN
ncbi:MAG: flagellar basal body P-ring formation chaperone FlgA [Arenimonas sp.]